MIGVVHYGLGNIAAFLSIYKRLNIAAAPVSTAEELAQADRIILPGVGSFDWAITRLEQAGLRPTLEALVQSEKRPVLGVCVGMQMMAKSSEEGQLAGFGWIDATTKLMRGAPGAKPLNLPHMGWNDVRVSSTHPLMRGLGSPQFYFLHSYHVAPVEPDVSIAVAEYGGAFTAAVGAGNVMGTQFHPEKSHESGIELLRNFAEL